MELSDDELARSAAAHEAGHAVVAWVLGLKVEAIRMGEHGSGLAKIECDARLPPVQRIAVASAGMEAVELLGALPWGQAGMSDAAKIEDLIEPYPEPEHGPLREQGYALARELLTDRVKVLAELADALALSGNLYGAELAAFADRCRRMD